MKKPSVFHCYNERISASNEYVVKKGDYLYKIANLYKVSVDDLIKANNLVSTVIYPNQVLLIPRVVDGGQTYFEQYSTVDNDTISKIAIKLGVPLDLLTKYNDLTKLILVENQIVNIPYMYKHYVVLESDTLDSILEKHNMTLEQLIKANINRWLAPGMEIIVK